MIKRSIIASIALLITTFIVGCSLFQPLPHDVKFYRLPCIRPYQDYNYLLCENILVEVDDELIIIPSEFETDLASVPRPFWTFISPNQSNLIAPAILHDYLYSCHLDYQRIEVDEIFYSSLISNGVSPFRAYTFYVAVRLFGFPHYHSEVSCGDRPDVLPDSDSNVDGEFLNCQDVFDGNANYL